MPVEIKELIIRAVVVEEEEEEDALDSPTAQESREGTEAIVEASVRQVLRILKKGKER